MEYVASNPSPRSATKSNHSSGGSWWSWTCFGNAFCSSRLSRYAPNCSASATRAPVTASRIGPSHGTGLRGVTPSCWGSKPVGRGAAGLARSVVSIGPVASVTVAEAIGCAPVPASAVRTVLDHAGIPDVGAVRGPLDLTVVAALAQSAERFTRNE